MMNKILNPCGAVEIDGQAFLVRTDFRVWIKAEEILTDPQIPWERGVARVLTMVYQVLPPDPIKAFEGIMWFLRGGVDAPEVQGDEVQPQLPLFSLKEDFPYIWAGFLGQFGIDLSRAEIHWWHFRTLLEALDSNSLLGRVVFYRQVNPSQVSDPNMRSFYMRMKKRYRLAENHQNRELATALAMEAGFD